MQRAARDRHGRVVREIAVDRVQEQTLGECGYQRIYEQPATDDLDETDGLAREAVAFSDIAEQAAQYVEQRGAKDELDDDERKAVMLDDLDQTARPRDDNCD